jgi:histidyl-tRNA synthetase
MTGGSLRFYGATMRFDLYNRNGLVFWTEKEIKLRRMIEDYLVMELKEVLLECNRAFDFVQVEAPILTPVEMINKNYTHEDYFQILKSEDNFKSDYLALRPETTMGSYRYARYLLDHQTRHRMPLVV